MRIFLFALACLLFISPLKAQDGEGVMRDLMIVNFWDCYLAWRYPVTYNHLLAGGVYQYALRPHGA